jgi:hypothetical protein
MDDFYTRLKGHEERIYAESERLKREITVFKERLEASDHPLKAVKLEQLQALLDRLAM